jgi:hypothetical protein
MMNRSEFMEAITSDMMYDAEWMTYSEALDIADRIWTDVWGADTEEVYLEEMVNELSF